MPKSQPNTQNPSNKKIEEGRKNTHAEATLNAKEKVGNLKEELEKYKEELPVIKSKIQAAQDELFNYQQLTANEAAEITRKKYEARGLENQIITLKEEIEKRTQEKQNAEKILDEAIAKNKKDLHESRIEHIRVKAKLEQKTQEYKESIADLEQKTKTNNQTTVHTEQIAKGRTSQIQDMNKNSNELMKKADQEINTKKAEIRALEELKKNANSKTIEAEEKATQAEQDSAKRIAAANLLATAAETKAAQLEQDNNTKTTAAALKEKEQTIANNSALGVSYLTGFIACIYSGTIQKMLFGKVFFGNSILLGYAAPAINLVMASMVFGLVAFGLTLTMISIAKSAEEKPILRGFTENIYFKILLITATCLAITKYAATIQIALFSTVLLGGTVLTNIGFALIATILVCSFLAIASANAIPKEYRFAITMYALSFIALCIYASPALLGSILIFMPPMLSNISFGAVASLITAPVLTALYKTTELAITPTVMEPAKAAEQIAEGASKIASTCTETLRILANSCMQTL